MDVILASVDLEHLESAAVDPRFAGDGEISFGTNSWPEPTKFPRDVPIYFYAVRTGDPEPYASWRGIFRRYLSMEQFASRAKLDATRPQTTIERRTHPLESEREPEWAGYLLVTGLERLDEDQRVPLRDFHISGKRFDGVVVRRPTLAQLD